MNVRTTFLSLILLFSVLLSCRPFAPQPAVPAPTATAFRFITATPVSSPAPTTTLTPRPTIPASPTKTQTPPSSPTPQPETDTIQQLLQIQLPNRNLDDLASRFKAEVKASPSESVNNFNLGDTDTFWVLDSNTKPPKQFQITSNLLYITDHSYWWVQDGYVIPEADIMASAQQFEENIYPTNRQFFGSEWSPGVDNDVRVHIVMGNVPGVAGYFSAANEYAQGAVDHSNQREMFLINLKAIQPGRAQFDSVIAHEFQHMIHWYQDSNEDTWVNEGLSELAKFINGYGQSSFVAAYLEHPDLQLTSWGREDHIRRANYGASFLFILYLYDKFGSEVIKILVAQPENGVTGVEQTLRQLGYSSAFDQLFADFIIANYLNDPTLAQGQWGYSQTGINFSSPQLAKSYTDFPLETADSVQQYGVDYIELVADAPLTITFSGSATTTLLDNRAHSGRYQWYSNRGDNSDATLTRLFDLRHLSEASLEFWVWYDIEADWDYAYVAVSTDGGKTWDILPATSTTDTNPSGNAYGPGFTGMSGSKPEWLKERADLSPYAGQEILLRFEYITDDAVNHPGFAVDDISIPQLGYMDDVEAGDGGWEAEGFFRTDNILSQKFIAQIIEFDADGEAVVKQILLDENNTGQYTLENPGQTNGRAILVVSAQAPVTTERAQYFYSITQN